MIPENQAPAAPETNHAPSPALADFAAFELKPRFECTSSGVVYIGVKADKDGEAYEQPPVKLSDSIRIIGRGKDEQGNHYRIIEWRDSHTRRRHAAALPMADIGMPACWQFLQSRGITVLSGRRKRELLADYLQTDGETAPYRVINKSGWTNNRAAYVLPSGEVLAAEAAAQPDRVIYNGDTSQAAAFQAAGTLAQWQAEIARYAAGNSRLCLAIGAALAAPLLDIIGEQNGGFHIYGDSSDGKTTAAHAALSVWGNPEALRLTWRGTDLGFSNAALSRNDGLLVLDEIGEAAPAVISRTAYSVINGKSKTQGAKDGGNRAAESWRIMLFSTGEYALSNYLQKQGMTWEAGQAVRLPSIPAATRHGIYDTLHGHKSGADLSEHINQAAQHQHGTAGRAWIAKLQSLDPTAIHAAHAAFMQIHPDLDGQARRVCRRFALAAAALELAADITGLPAGVGMAGISQCFTEWLAANGTGKSEDRRIIEQAATFMQLYAETARFSDWNAEYTNHDHAGYRRKADSGGNQADYWIIPAVFHEEVIKGGDINKSCLVLSEIQWLKKNDKGGRWQFQRYGKGRFYVLHGICPPDDSENE